MADPVSTKAFPVIPAMETSINKRLSKFFTLKGDFGLGGTAPVSENLEEEFASSYP